MRYRIYPYLGGQQMFHGTFSECYQWCVDKGFEVWSRDGDSGQYWLVMKK